MTFRAIFSDFVPVVFPRRAKGERSAFICQGQIKINAEKLLPSHVFQQVGLMAAEEQAEYF
jgi:hypothetical protein